MNILISANTNFMGPASVMVYSLCQSHKDIGIDIYLAYHDLRKKDIEWLQKLVSYFEKKRLYPIDVGEEFASRITSTERFSYEIYYRILVLNMLPKDMKRILYLDADMLVKKNLTEVYETHMSERCPFVVCADMMGPTRGGTNRGIIPDSCQYFNSGFMLINLDYLRKRGSIDYILDAFFREHDRYPYPDQDILNCMYYDKIQFVPWSLYNLAPQWWKIDIVELSRGKIRFASYLDMNNQAIDYERRFIDVTVQMRDNAYIIHYLAFLKPWLYRDKPMYSDLAVYAGLWFACEKEMYKSIENMSRL